MRKDAIQLEERRLNEIDDIQDYPSFKERHRVFPAVFESRQHRKILDLSAGVGCAAQRIRASYPAFLVANDVSPTCLKILHKLKISTISFDLDDRRSAFPFPDGHFDALISLVTIEHILDVDHFMQEIHRILCDQGYLYISTPNYAAPEYLINIIRTGRTFHNPFWESSRYEFYAHVRYFTYITLLEYISSFGFQPDSVYLALPGGSTRYQALYARSKFSALAYRYARWLMFRLSAPRWTTEPIVCFQKTRRKNGQKIRKVVL